MGLSEEFKKFVLRGNVVDLAVGVIIGGAFGKIVSSAVEDLIMPPIGLVTGGVSFVDKFVVLKDGAKAPPPYESLAKAKEAGANVLAYGQFVNHIITFLIVAMAVFVLVKLVNKLYPPPAAPDDKRDCPHCAMSIMKKATRCPHCTSTVEPVKVEAKA